MKPTKILMTIRQGEVGGGESHVFDLSTNLDQKLYDPHVLAFTDGALIQNLKKKGIKTHVIYTKVPFDVRVRKQVKAYIQENNIEMVHAHGTRAASNSLHVANKLGLPILYTVHGWSFNDNQSTLKHKLRIASERYITRKVNQTINVSEGNQNAGKKYIRDFNSVIINYGISFERFNPNLDKTALRKEFGFEDDEIWVGFIARITYQKDPLTTLKAFKAASSKNEKLRLLMVGEGDMQEEVDAFIEKNKLHNVVKRMGFQSRVPDLLTAVDIFTLVSRWEGLPIGLLESMAMKSAIIASKVDGTKEFLSHGENGFLVEKEDVEHLTDCLLKLAESEELREKFGEAVHALARKKFGVDRMVTETQAVYENFRNSSAQKTS
ncbi:MAG: glycosyltransferase [Bacteroidota bacterium]